MKTRLPLVPLVILAGCAPSPSRLDEAPKRTLPGWAAGMVDYLQATQIASDLNPRFVGGWPVRANNDGTLTFWRRESDVFVPLQISLSLHRLAEHYEVPGLAAMDERIAPLVSSYLDDAKNVGDEPGTLNFWALYPTPYGFPVHHPGVPIITPGLARIMNVPSDADTGSQASLWMALQRATAVGGTAAFQAAFPVSLSHWIDADRPAQHPVEDGWKHVGSGAFLTWTEPEARIKADSRIPGGTNDVDCVVNLNILHALAAVAPDQTLPEGTRRGRDAACTLLVAAANDDAGARCSVYYDEGQFQLAYARALAGGASCLEPGRASVLASATRLADLALQDGAGPVRLAELLLALKEVAPPPRTDAAEAEISRLAAALRATTVQDDVGRPYLPEAFLFRGAFKVFPLLPTMRVYWTSPAMSTAEGMLALLTD